jgi:uncharacterized protein YPO0396
MAATGISGKLMYKDSPFSDWVANRISSHGVDHLCVNSTDQLAGEDPRITRSGQLAVARQRHSRLNSTHHRLQQRRPHRLSRGGRGIEAQSRTRFRSKIVSTGSGRCRPEAHQLVLDTD